MALHLTTSIKDIDWKIFHELSDKDLIHLCQLNKEMKKLCENEEYWESRTKFWYGKQIQSFRHRKQIKKPTYLTWKGFYIQLTQMPNIFSIVKKLEPNIATVTINALPFASNRPIREGDIVEFYDSQEDKTAWKYIVSDISNKTITLKKIKHIGTILHFPIDSVLISNIKMYRDFINITMNNFLYENKTIHIEIGYKRVYDVKRDVYGDLEFIKLQD